MIRCRFVQGTEALLESTGSIKNRSAIIRIMTQIAVSHNLTVGERISLLASKLKAFQLVAGQFLFIDRKDK